MKQLTIAVLITLLAGACQANTGSSTHQMPTADETATTEQVAQLEGQVMAVHDQVMPLMSELMRLKKSVSAKVDTSRTGDRKQQGVVLGQQLGQAGEAMMNWMQQYNSDTLAKLNPAQRTRYLQSQQTKINEVRDQMRQRIADAKKFLR